jgi:EmrB/QacA subfamily drug resistance transporter
MSVACGTFMATLDSSIVNIALPTLTKEFDCDLYQVKWVVVIYLLIITCLLLPFGRLSDQFGRKPVFLTGYFIFTLGSVLCGVAPSLNFLIMARVIQALGVSMMMANGPAIITSTFQSNERGSALGILAMFVSAGLLCGPSIGGFLIAHLGWRSIFWVNLPIGLIGMVMVYTFVKEHGTKQPAPFDWAGAFFQTILLLAFIVIFDPPSISISGGIHMPISRLAMVAVTILLGIVFIKIESQAEAPLLDIGLLKNRTFWSANLAAYLTFVAYSAVTVLMPFFLEEIMKFPPQKAGLFMTAIPVTILIVAPISGRLSDRVGSQELSFSGALIGSIGLFFMSGVFGSGVRAGMGALEVVLSLAVMGLATGLFQSPNNNSIMGAVPANKLGVASAMLATVRNLGLVTGTGLATSIFSWRMASTGDFVGSLHVTQFIAGCIAFLAMCAALLKPRSRRPELTIAGAPGGAGIRPWHGHRRKKR